MPGSKKAVETVVLTLLVFAAVEGGLRLSGRRPLERPAERNAPILAAHERLGYVLTPGTTDFDLREGDWTRKFRVTRNASGRRITRPPTADAGAVPRPQLWIFGCSFAFGALLSDEETFPWIAQERLPEYEVVNFGVSGYSTLHSLIQLDEELRKPPRPAVAILTYADFQQRRNVCSRRWQQSVMTRFEYPCASIGPDGQLNRVMATRMSGPLPLARQLAIAGTLDEALSRLDEGRHRAGEVTERLISEFVALGRRERIRVAVAVIAGAAQGSEMLRRLAVEGVPVLDIAPDYRQPATTFAPHDMHPAPLGARLLGERLAEELREKMLR
jgi:hypothetical protein